jgi:hypothetical protein
MNVCGGTPYANVFKGSNRRAARLDLSNPSLTIHDIFHEHLEASPGDPEHQLELNTKQWIVTNVISFNAGKSKIVSKQPSSAPWQLPVIYLPLLLLLLIVKCSNNHPTLQYSKDEFVDIHSCTGAQERGQQDSDCNGKGKGARGMGQQQWGNGDAGDRSINCNDTGAGALGQEQQEQQKRNGAMAMGQRRCDHRHCDRSIDRVPCAVCGCGAWAWAFCSVCFNRKS